jgi:hypothetical protein
MEVIQLDETLQGADYWDLNLIKWVVEQVDDTTGVYIVPGAYQEYYVEQVNEVLTNLPYALVLVTSDEENLFNIQDLCHPNMTVWHQYSSPEMRPFADRLIPIGAPRNDFTPQRKDNDWCFSGQVFHPARGDLMEAMQDVPNGVLISSGGFTQGLSQDEYRDLMSHTRVALCPGGPNSPDSFRLYEALESGCIPIVDDRDFFTAMFGEFPFPCVDTWAEAPALVELCKSDPVLAGECFGWWHDYRWQMVANLKEDLWSLRSPS